MAFSNLFRRYSTSNEIQATDDTYMDLNSVAETLLDELESQCQNCLTSVSLKTKRNSQASTDSNLESSFSRVDNFPAPKRHSSVDYSWLTPNKNLLQASNETYHLSDIIKIELGELIRNVLAEDCTWIINQFRRQIRVQSKESTPENIIALFRKTISDYIDKKPKTRGNTNDNEGMNFYSKSNPKSTTANGCSFGRNNRINPKYQLDDEQHCIAELTEISISSSSNEGTDNAKLHLSSQT